MRLAVVGQGYVGLPLALASVAAGHDVLGFDTDATRVAMLRSGMSYVSDVTVAELRAALDSGRYAATDDAALLAGFDVAVIAVPTGLRDGRPDLSHVEEAARLVAPHVGRGSTVVLESTTYPGTTTELLVPILEAGSGLGAGEDFAVGYSPERVDPGNATWTYTSIPKVVAGIDEASLAAVQAFYATVVDSTVPVASTAVAELSKLVENTFRHVNVALVNELAMYAGALGVDVWDAIAAASTKPFGYLPFQPGPGVGGHCLPVDPSYLSWRVEQQSGEKFRFIELANEVNAHMPQHVVERIIRGLAARGLEPGSSRVLVLGLAYKADTGDLRGSPGLEIARLLAAAGAEVRVADPMVVTGEVPGDLTLVPASVEEVRQADLVVLTAAHSTFDLAMVGREATYVFDTRHRVEGPAVEYL